mmetsp:Transcript_26323/g.70248  ORF Transcript_26323/g.70248 Transcript_26323/m.70248 type:complete len:242 (+) Transcript_26323:37-762(+)
MRTNTISTTTTTTDAVRHCSGLPQDDDDAASEWSVLTDDAASEWSVLFADDDVAHPCDDLAPAQCCAHCGATNLRLLRCARCLDVTYCGKLCQRAAWSCHKPSCRQRHAPPQQADSAELASRLKSATTLARQREGRAITAAGRGFRPRSEWVELLEAKKETPRYETRRAPLEAARVRQALFPRNNERGVQCHGQGKRHQNPAAHVQPSMRTGGRQAKWSNPNPQRSRPAAVKAKKNFKAVQ